MKGKRVISVNYISQLKKNKEKNLKLQQMRTIRTKKNEFFSKLNPKFINIMNNLLNK